MDFDLLKGPILKPLMNILPGGLRRFLRFNLVAMLGLMVKFSVLTGLVEYARLGYMIATAIAVETTVLHNFTWHYLYTWRDRSIGISWRAVLLRLVKFQFANGTVGLVGNLVLMRLFVDGLKIHYFPANVAATAISGLVNFLLSEFFVFLAPHSRFSRQPGAK